MKAYLRELIPDLKAAARIGHPHSLQAGLDGLRALPEVRGNSKLQLSFIESVILPAGLALSSRSLALDLLEQILQNDPLAGVRATSAVALGARYAAGENVPDSVLRKAGLDERAEVRQALTLGMTRLSSHPERLVGLLQSWLQDQSPRLQESALLALPALQIADPRDFMAQICTLDPGVNEAVDKALVTALVSLADRGAGEAVIACLEEWANLDTPPLWVITSTMMRGWVSPHSHKADEILSLLQARLGLTKEIARCHTFVAGVSTTES